jgi:hypothetical protein
MEVELLFSSFSQGIGTPCSGADTLVKLELNIKCALLSAKHQDRQCKHNMNPIHCRPFWRVNYASKLETVQPRKQELKRLVVS